MDLAVFPSLSPADMFDPSEYGPLHSEVVPRSVTQLITLTLINSGRGLLTDNGEI